MFEIERPNILMEEESDDKSFARLVCEPLERGYGTTLGNSLRRIMLSTLQGYAVSQIKIDGVYHEFSTIDGVKEDVTEIIMNLKELAIRSTNNEYIEKIATLNFEGDGVVHASDIIVDSDIEIVNKDLVIAHLCGKNAKLNMQLVITPGRGYIPSEKNKENLKGVEYIAIDSIYDPVERVNMKVENTRVGNKTDFDKLTLEVKTNGTMSAKDAVSLAAKVLSEHIKLFIDLSELGKAADVIGGPEGSGKGGPEDPMIALLKRGINELDLSVRSYNSLKRAGINTVGDLIKMSPEKLKDTRNLGQKSLDEIVQKVSDLGLTFNMNSLDPYATDEN